MGVVYKARQLRPRRLVALKVVLAGEHAGADALARFRVEAEAAARLSHPNIVQLHEVGEHQGRPFLTLELVEGGTLAQKLSEKSFGFAEAAGLLYQLARAVQFAHEHGVIHRDLKPANVLLAPASGGLEAQKTPPPAGANPRTPPPEVGADCVPKIADFGLARQIEGMTSVAVAAPRTQSGAILGTPSYMAPEQAGGKRHTVGPAADVYALGAILYECLTGRPPFQGATMLHTLMQLATQEPVPPRRLRPKCPRDLETICLKCLEKDPKRRYASAGDLADDLRRYLEGKPTACRPPGALERLGRAVRRRKELVYVAAGAVTALCVSLVALALWSPRGGEVPPTGNAERPAEELPADLNLVPHDAFAFATVRVADLWTRQEVKDLLTALSRPNAPAAPDPGKALAEFQRDTGIALEDVERMTLVVPRETSPGEPVTVIALNKPCDPTRVYEVLADRAPMLPSQAVQGKKVYARGNDPSSFAFCPFSDRVLLLGPTGRIRALLDRGADARPPDSGAPLGGALTLAAQGHHLVIGVHPLPASFRAMKQFLPEKQVEPFTGMESASLVLDLPGAPEGPGTAAVTGLSVDLTLSFHDEARAKQGASAAAVLLKDVGRNLKPADLPPWLGGGAPRLGESLRTAEWRQEGRQVRLALRFTWTDADLEGLRAAANVRRSAPLNNEAWRLVTGPADQRDPGRALQLIQQAVQLDPANPLFLNTLGVVQYRNGLYKEAAATLEKSLAAGQGKQDAFDLFFLAMCHAKLGDDAKARDCFDRAVQWVEQHSAQHDAQLKAFRAEAEEALKTK
jgi:hypothetical protein